MLAYYQTQTSRLLQNPAAPTSLYSTTDLTSYINTMRGQLAGEAECIRRTGTLVTVVGQQEYNFSSITVADAAVAGVMNVRFLSYAVGTGFKLVYPRPWEWMQLYSISNPVPQKGAPTTWAQLKQGSAGQGAITNVGSGSLSTGTLWIDPAPDTIYNLSMDCVCYPIQLTVDTDPEAIPYLWTDAIPFGAAWYALLSAQTSQRMAEAEKYLGYYATYVQKARQYNNPSVDTYQYEQVPNITLPNKIGFQPPRGGGQ